MRTRVQQCYSPREEEDAVLTTFSNLPDACWNSNRDDRELEEALQTFLAGHRKGGRYEVNGQEFVCPGNIYQPHEFGSTRFVLRGIFAELPRWGHRVLEIGTGSGAVGIALAATGRDVTLVDIDPVAVACSRENAVRNNVSVKVVQSDLFAALGQESYDLIIFNIPLMDRSIEEPLERICNDPEGVLFTRFMVEAKAYLAPGGAVCVSVANIGHRSAMLRALEDYDESIIFSEFYGATQDWRWLLVAQPKTPTS